ncbi:hypothetical protein [Actinomadura rayongensis]|uniref:Small secreted protein n=1 Tax=Actinomadura rayongensis TaxID=1429076 RepID=A0A6I4WBT6_9ACTN|nr:hypothetical protein [Actinomadura rayongensis]MXQ67041.1 hypothetical protein [Actinomadura rayongensis]
MRLSASSLVGALMVGGAVLGATACGPIDSVTGGGAKKSACNSIESTLRSLTTVSTPDLSNPTASATANAQKYSDAAAKIRSAGQDAGGDVESAAGAFATDLESTASTLRSLGSGNLSGGTSGLQSLGQMQQHAQDLGKACGFSGTGFRFGS